MPAGERFLWLNRTKIELFGHNEWKDVWRSYGEAVKHNNTDPMFKQVGGNLQLKY